MLHNAAGAVQSHSDKGFGCCYLIGRGQFLVCLVTWLDCFFTVTWNSFCLPISNLTTFEAVCLAFYWIMSLQMEPISKSWEFLRKGKFTDIHFVLQRSTHPQSKRFGVQEICMELSGSVDAWVNSEPANILLRALKDERFSKRTEKCKILCNLKEKQVENLKDLDSPKFKILQKQMMQCGFARVTRSDTNPHFVVQSEKSNCWKIGQCSIWSCRFRILKCNVSINGIESLKKVHLFDIHYWEIARTRQMTDQEDETSLGKFVFDDKNQEKKTWSFSRQTCSRSLIVFLSQLFVIFLIIFGWFWRIHLLKNLWRINSLGGIFV